MTEGWNIYVRPIEEVKVPGKPLGRHVRHDSRSLAYAAPESDLGSLTSVEHNVLIPVLDQGELGSCTGNAGTYALGSDPFNATIQGFHLVLNEDFAVKLYSQTTTYDSDPDNYPPTDTGSDGLSVGKALKADGYVSGYTHALSLNALLTALQSTPVIIGINWYSSMDEPDGNGLVTITDDAYVRGGHEVCVVGMDTDKQLVKIINSWGTSFGIDGYFWMSYDTLERLLGEDGDCTVFTPINVPAPIPTPVPTPTPGPTPTPTPVPPTPTPPVNPNAVADAKFAKEVDKMLARHPFFYRSFWQAAKDWRGSLK